MPRCAGVRRIGAGLAAIAGVTVVGLAAVVHAAPVLREARADIRMTSPAACEVALTLTVEGAAEITHRLDTRTGTRVDLLGVEGARVTAPPNDVAHTRALTVQPSARPYTIRYRVELPSGREYHCPIWLPAAPADGRSRAVVIDVMLPDGAVAAGTMPALRWTGASGVATTGHLPAFVVVPYAAAGEPRAWDVSRVMDAVAVATLVAASLLWLRRAGARRRSGAGEARA